jgi:hypothetical protein
MKTETLKALKKSITHWKNNVEKAKQDILKMADILSPNCALCKKFKSNPNSFCFLEDESCPIKVKVKYWGCNGTPWVEVWECLTFTHSKNKLIRCCRKELKFLESLLPKQKLKQLSL